ncbi:MAG TPA: ATP-binding cassette domain-containing protein [Chthoniobacteraceae bacterium]|nr:ATP-binding cassette domain-containing protein [Chthoniobacteraceae bacterium]
MPSPTAPTLRVTDLTLIRDGTRILDKVSWEVAPGEHWAILGANGSGKTSLLSALTGYQTPTAGKLFVLGQEYGASNWVELRKRIGIVSSAVRQQMPDHEPGLITVLSGKYAMIDYWGRIRTADKEEAREILRQIDSEHLADRPWMVLSQGERQRILIGRALMAHPELLILDEPCAGLDPVARDHFLQFVERLTRKKSAPALMLVTHHVEEIVEGISHVLVLKAGRVLAAEKRAKALKNEVLSEAFGEAVRLVRRQGRLWLELVGKEKPSKHLFTRS